MEGWTSWWNLRRNDAATGFPVGIRRDRENVFDDEGGNWTHDQLMTPLKQDRSVMGESSL